MLTEFDKVLREKLKDHKADYNSADWEKMESMLPKEPRKPYEFLALLLLLIGVAGLWVGVGNVPGESVTAQKKISGRSEGANSNNNETTFVGEGISAQSSERQRVESEHKGATNTDIAGTQKKQVSFLEEKSSRDKIFNGNENTSASTAASGAGRTVTLHSFIQGGVEVSPPGEEVKVESRKPKPGKGLFDAPGSKKSSATDLTSDKLSETEISTSFGSQSSSVRGNVIAGGKLPIEKMGLAASVFALNEMEAGLIEMESDEKTLEVLLLFPAADPRLDKKPKKQIVAFAVGAGAGMNLSYTERDLMTNPGFSTGFAEELMFINRIGLAFTQSFSQTKYDGGKYPYVHGMPICPSKYTTTVSSVDFGVDVKGNIIHKPRWNWYLKAGVNNVVKIKEQYEYYYPEVDTVVTEPPLPPKTNFNGTIEALALDNNGLQQTDPVYPADIAMSGNKRYHLAFHFATGFDIILTSRITLQFEGGHSFTRPTVGKYDMRWHSHGLNGRVFYCF